MDRYLMPIFAIAMLAVFALPAYAMESNVPPAPDVNVTPILAAAPNGTEPGLPPMPGERPAMNGTPTGTRFNGTAQANGTAILPSTRAQAIRDRVVNAINGTMREMINASNVKALVAQRVKEFDDAKHLALTTPMNDTQAFILQVKDFADTLNATQRNQFNQMVFGFLNQSMDNRIGVANRFGTRGTDNATIEAYINSTEQLKAQIAAANSTKQRRDLVLQANRQWAEFKKDVVKEAARDRILNATDKAQAALGKLDAIIANLAQNGTDTAKLVNISARVQLRITAASEQNITLRQAEWRLAYARDGLAHLAAQVKRAVKAEAVEDLQEQAEPAGLDVEDAVETGPVATTMPTTVANATASQ
ncbi:MAG: hypothetical protein WCX64_05275 [Candidatus Micrarchaeia archaeon]|jgi:hypothetical protein